MDSLNSEKMIPHILIVDDDELISSMLSLSAGRFGYREGGYHPDKPEKKVPSEKQGQKQGACPDSPQT